MFDFEGKFSIYIFRTNKHSPLYCENLAQNSYLHVGSDFFRGLGKYFFPR